MHSRSAGNPIRPRHLAAGVTTPSTAGSPRRQSPVIRNPPRPKILTTLSGANASTPSRTGQGRASLAQANNPAIGGAPRLESAVGTPSDAQRGSSTLGHPAAASPRSRLRAERGVASRLIVCPWWGGRGRDDADRCPFLQPFTAARPAPGGTLAITGDWQLPAIQQYVPQLKYRLAYIPDARRPGRGPALPLARRGRGTGRWQ
jgi:hypothetical protein